MSARDRVAGFPVVVELPVQWGDMDAYGHVNNTAFFRYFETARIEYLVRCGFAELHERDGIGAILHSTSCRFRRPLVFPDRVLSATRVSRREEDRFEMEYVLVSLEQDVVAAQGTGIVVSYDYRAGSVTPIPEDVVRGMEALAAP